MTPPTAKFRHRSRIGLMANVLIANVMLSSFMLAPIALADDDKAPPSGRSSGGRGCGLSAPSTAKAPALMLLTPHQKRGKTASTRPTFAWFVRDAVERPLEFRLYEVIGAQYKLLQEIRDNQFKSTPGIMVLSETVQMPELTVGKRYRWQVEMVCDAARPSSNLFAAAELDVVPMQTELKQQLKQNRDRPDQIKLLYQKNLWYDALAQALLTIEPMHPIRDLRLTLLNQVATNAMELQLLQESVVHRISY